MVISLATFVSWWGYWFATAKFLYGSLMGLLDCHRSFSCCSCCHLRCYFYLMMKNLKNSVIFLWFHGSGTNCRLGKTLLLDTGCYNICVEIWIGRLCTGKAHEEDHSRHTCNIQGLIAMTKYLLCLLSCLWRELIRGDGLGRSATNHRRHQTWVRGGGSFIAHVSIWMIFLRCRPVFEK